MNVKKIQKSEYVVRFDESEFLILLQALRRDQNASAEMMNPEPGDDPLVIDAFMEEGARRYKDIGIMLKYLEVYRPDTNPLKTHTPVWSTSAHFLRKWATFAHFFRPALLALVASTPPQVRGQREN